MQEEKREDGNVVTVCDEDDNDKQEDTKEKKHRRGRGEGCIIKVGNKYYGRLVECGHVIKKPLSRKLLEAKALWSKWLRLRNPEKYARRMKLKNTWTELSKYYHDKGASDRSISVRKSYWTRIVSYFAEIGLRKPSDIVRGNVVDMIEHVGAGRSSATRRRLLYTLRDVYSICFPDISNPTIDVKVRDKNDSGKWVLVCNMPDFSMVSQSDDKNYIPQEVKDVLDECSSRVEKIISDMLAKAEVEEEEAWHDVANKKKRRAISVRPRDDNDSLHG